ncbi:MAG TPA: sulfite exporter TauE/SafE family protein, partial [Stellaceae bacterium]|nr:sulfite exporter TauE/SafE family protein [Stellaceae bacterium]
TVAVGAAAGGLVQGLSGFAFGLVALGIWAWVVAPTLAGPLVVFGSLIGQLLALRAARPGFDMARLAPFLIGGVVGVPIGVLLLRLIDPVGFKLVVGIILVLWCPAMLLARDLPSVTRGGRVADGVAGWVGGIMGGLGGLNGPAPVLWCALRGWSRDTQRAVIQTFSLATQALTMAMYVATGTIHVETLRLFLIVAVAMPIPTLAGARLYQRVSDIWFRRMILALLTLSGAVLIGSTVPRLF